MINIPRFRRLAQYDLASDRLRRGERSRSSRSALLRPEILEDRVLLAGSPGSLDPSFGTGGMVTTLIGSGSTAAVGALQPDEKIVVAGGVVEASGQGALALARYLPDGQLDTTFGPSHNGEDVLNPSLKLDGASSIAVVSDPGQADDGDFVVSGAWYDPATLKYGSALARFTPSGSPDTSFAGTGVILEPQSSTVTITGPLLIQPGGKILVGGVKNGASQLAVVERFNVDGTPDSTFANPGVNDTLLGTTSSVVRGLAFDGGGNIIVAGSEGIPGPIRQTNVIALARLMPNGAIDQSFGSGGVETTNIASLGTLGGVDGVAIDPSGNIVVGGSMVPTGASSSFFAARYNPRGDLDPAFNHGAVDFITISESPQTLPTGVVVQKNSGILVGGMIQSSGTDPEGPTAFALFRLNADGTLDNSFGTAGEALTDLGRPDDLNDPHSVLLQPSDGNIVMVGGSSNVFALARFIGGPGSSGPPPIPNPPVVGSINTPHSNVRPGATAVVSASFIYDTSSGPCTAIWNWSDGSTSAGFVSESNGMGTVTGSHTYNADGFYPVSLTITDSTGASGSSIAIPGILVVLPVVGNIRGSGTIASPRGALSSSRLLSGKATFSLSATAAASGAASGKFVLKLKSAHLSFQSTRLESLGENGAILEAFGSGTINGSGSYNFLLSTTTRSGRAGKFRLQIWETRRCPGYHWSTTASPARDHKPPRRPLQSRAGKIHASISKKPANTARCHQQIAPTGALINSHRLQPMPFLGPA